MKARVTQSCSNRIGMYSACLVWWKIKNIHIWKSRIYVINKIYLSSCCAQRADFQSKNIYIAIDQGDRAKNKENATYAIPKASILNILISEQLRVWSDCMGRHQYFEFICKHMRTNTTEFVCLWAHIQRIQKRQEQFCKRASLDISYWIMCERAWKIYL